jgi:hypothetical protein
MDIGPLLRPPVIAKLLPIAAPDGNPSANDGDTGGVEAIDIE